MNIKDYFDSIDLNEINRFVDESQEEHVTLDFKSVNHPYRNGNDKGREDDKENYSKALSGFANSGGGIIIWGIKTTKNKIGDVAGEKRPIHELTRFLNDLNRLEGSAVVPTVRGIENISIPESEDIGYVKTFIPESSSAPHMALFGKKNYFKRNGDSFIICEHYDLMDMMSRKKAPELKLILRNIEKTTYKGMECNKILFSIFNSGNVIAKFPYLALRVGPGIWQYEFGINENGATGLMKVKNNTNYTFNYSGGSDIVIYPKSNLDVDFLMFQSKERSLRFAYYLAAENMEAISKEIFESDYQNTDFEKTY